MVLPAFNEELVIAQSVARVDRLLASLSGDYELLVGDDGSSDGTAGAVRAVESERVRLISRPHRGKGGILTACLTEARGDYLAFLDADLEIDADYLPRLIAELDRGADAAIASKAKDPTLARRRPLRRRVPTVVFNALVRVLFRSPLRDHQAGMKAFRGAVLRRYLSSITNTGWLWDTEVMVTLLHFGHRVVEVPIETGPSVRPTKVGVVRTSINMLRDLLRLYIHKRAAWAGQRHADRLGNHLPASGSDLPDRGADGVSPENHLRRRSPRA